MKKVTLLISILFLTENLISQTRPICLVKYKDLKTALILGTHNYWCYNDKLVSTKTPNIRVIHMRRFPVVIDGKMTSQSDTIKYNKEFNEFVNEMQENLNKEFLEITIKSYNSEFSKTNMLNDYENKRYTVVDTFKKMNTWEVFNDTLSILGFKCQKAIITHKQRKYTAWFCAQLPFNAGPDEFYGLPGLILKVYDNNNINVGYEAIEIQLPFKKSVPSFNFNSLEITRKDWSIIVDERNKKMWETINNLKKQVSSPTQ